MAFKLNEFESLGSVEGWKTRQPAPDVTVIDLPPTDRVTYYTFLLMSDGHIDHTDHVAEVFDGLSREAMQRGAGILHNGDTLCAMQGRNDKRHNKASLKDELKKNAYWNALCKYGYDRLKPFKENLMWIGYGNHETAPIKNSEVDPLSMIVERLNETGGNIALGQYRSWVIIRAAKKSGSSDSYRIRAFHGSGGGGPVTKAMIAHQRLIAQTDGADLIWTGHVHEYHDSLWIKDGLDSKFNPYPQKTYAVTTPGCKDEHKGGNGWAVERGIGGKPLGGAWLTLRYTPEDNALTHHSLYHACYNG